MRIDYEDLQLYTKVMHLPLEELLRNAYIENVRYFEQTGKLEEWFLKSSPFHIYDVLETRNTGVYEIWYDYIKRRIKRRSTIFDFGAGIGTLEVLLLKRYPSEITASELNLVCTDFIKWRMQKHGFCLAPLNDHYDYVVSLNTLQYLAPEDIKPTLERLLHMGDRCFIYINTDSRHPFYNEIPFDIFEFLQKRSISMVNYHGLWDIKMVEDENSSTE